MVTRSFKVKVYSRVTRRGYTLLRSLKLLLVLEVTESPTGQQIYHADLLFRSHDHYRSRIIHRSIGHSYRSHTGLEVIPSGKVRINILLIPFNNITGHFYRSPQVLRSLCQASHQDPINPFFRSHDHYRSKIIYSSVGHFYRSHTGLEVIPSGKASTSC